MGRYQEAIQQIGVKFHLTHLLLTHQVSSNSEGVMNFCWNDLELPYVRRGSCRSGMYICECFERYSQNNSWMFLLTTQFSKLYFGYSQILFLHFSLTCWLILYLLLTLMFILQEEIIHVWSSDLFFNSTHDVFVNPRQMMLALLFSSWNTLLIYVKKILFQFCHDSFTRQDYFQSVFLVNAHALSTLASGYVHRSFS